MSDVRKYNMEMLELLALTHPSSYIVTFCNFQRYVAREFVYQGSGAHSQPSIGRTDCSVDGSFCWCENGTCTEVVTPTSGQEEDCGSNKAFGEEEASSSPSNSSGTCVGDFSPNNSQRSQV